jgi:hypothetical protein
MFSDEESSPLVQRARSANLTGDRDSQQTKQSKSKHAKKLKLKVSQSELFSQYPQLNTILQKDKHGKKPEELVAQGRLRPHFRSAVDIAGQNSVAASRDSLVSLSSNRSQASKKISVEVLDEIVHRRAPGPLIFKDKESPIPSLRETRLNRYYPAENYVKHMDKKAAMEKQRQLHDEIERQLAENEEVINRHEALLMNEEANAREEELEHHLKNETIDAEQFLAKKVKKAKKGKPTAVKYIILTNCYKICLSLYLCSSSKTYSEQEAFSLYRPSAQ